MPSESPDIVPSLAVERSTHKPPTRGAYTGMHAVARGRKVMTWREAIDWAIQEYREDLDKLREYDLKARKPAKA